MKMLARRGSPPRPVERFTPEASPVRVAYMIARPGAVEMALWRRDVAAVGAVPVLERDVVGAMARAIETRAIEGAAGLLETLRRYSMALDDVASTLLLPELARAVDAIERDLIQIDSDVARIHAAAHLYRDVAPFLACRRFLAAVEGLSVDLARDGDGLIAEPSLDRLPAGHVAAIGWRAIALGHRGSAAAGA